MSKRLGLGVAPHCVVERTVSVSLQGLRDRCKAAKTWGDVDDILREFDPLILRCREVEQECAELRAWKAKEQTGLLSMAVALLNTGFTGTGVLDGIKFLKDRIAEREARCHALEQQIAELKRLSALGTTDE